MWTTEAKAAHATACAEMAAAAKQEDAEWRAWVKAKRATVRAQDAEEAAAVAWRKAKSARSVAVRRVDAAKKSLAEGQMDDITTEITTAIDDGGREDGTVAVEDRMTEQASINAFRAYAAACPYRIDLPVERRPGNALNVEIGAPMPRCRLRTPEHWGGASALRWLGSGGTPLVLGNCVRSQCPLLTGP